MKIAILGTRGIPNKYGGFEQFAEFLSVGLVKKGHNVTVYNPHFHEFKGQNFQGVNIKRKYSPESVIGSAANFVYDYLCLRDALKQDFDVILECGYGSVSVSYFITPIKKSIIVTNMDGMEWMRAKWSKPVKKLTKKFEEWGVKKSHSIVSDNEGIRSYFLETYGVDSKMIPYGAEIFRTPENQKIKKFEVSPGNYLLLIARLEPENNIEMILDGYHNSGSDKPILVIGNSETEYGKYLVNKYEYANIRFLGGIYDQEIINNLRFFSLAYFHGHSVGGTNPSLLEAMACSCFIIAHKNRFNESVLKKNAVYFENSDDVKSVVGKLTDFRTINEDFIAANLFEIETMYSWDKIVDSYENLFNSLIQNN